MAVHVAFSPRARVAGALLVVAGAWGAVVPFAGPSFGYSMGSTRAWTWTESEATLHFAPGLAVVLGALLVLRGQSVLARFGAALAGLGGAWLIIGPSLHPLWAGSGSGMMMMMGGSATSRALSDLGYHYGTGAVIALLAGYAMGALGTSRHAAVPRVNSAALAGAEPREFVHAGK